jgi:hypothetical protein
VKALEAELAEKEESLQLAARIGHQLLQDKEQNEERFQQSCKEYSAKVEVGTLLFLVSWLWLHVVLCRAWNRRSTVGRESLS